MTERRGEAGTKLRPWFYNQNEGAGPWWKTAQWTWWPTIRGKYLGTLAKGWWRLGSTGYGEHFEIEFALGGEDNMVQAKIVLPWLGLWTVGLRLPSKLLKGWIYDRRSWALRIGYAGRWIEVMFASDEHMRDSGMVRYYRKKRESGEELPWSRAALWPGWHLSFTLRLRDRLLGRTECHTVEGPPEPVTVPMPEGSYPATLCREDREWKRPRWPWASQKRREYRLDLETGIPVPGKGENSWDIEDDAVMGVGGKTPADAIANAVRSALRSRRQYAGEGWTPEKGWPLA